MLNACEWLIWNGEEEGILISLQFVWSLAAAMDD
jgi:hypothetical protein